MKEFITLLTLIIVVSLSGLSQGSPLDTQDSPFATLKVKLQSNITATSFTHFSLRHPAVHSVVYDKAYGEYLIVSFCSFVPDGKDTSLRAMFVGLYVTNSNGEILTNIDEFIVIGNESDYANIEQLENLYSLLYRYNCKYDYNDTRLVKLRSRVVAQVGQVVLGRKIALDKNVALYSRHRQR